MLSFQDKNQLSRYEHKSYMNIYMTSKPKGVQRNAVLSVSKSSQNTNAIKCHKNQCFMMPEVGKSKRDVKVSVVPKRELKLAAYLEGRVFSVGRNRIFKTSALTHQRWWM